MHHFEVEHHLFFYQVISHSTSGTLRYGTPFLKADYHIKIKTTEMSLVVKLTFKSTYIKL